MKNDDACDAPWMSVIEPTLRGKILACGSLTNYPRGEVLYAQGSEQRCLWMLQDGQLHARALVGDAQPRFIHLLGPGFWFGEWELLTGQPAALSLVAATDVTVLRIPAENLQVLLQRRPEIWQGSPQRSAAASGKNP